MKIKFMGAARTVTGSCYILETDSHRFAVDCGMHQGNADIEKRNWDIDIYNPEKIEFIIITHAHIDHSGLLPRMVQYGFDGKIYMTPPTADLLRIMLLDSAYIQEMEAQWRSKKRLRHGEKNMKPLYTQKDAEATFDKFTAVDYDKTFEPCPGLKITFRDAGHILGASFIELLVEEGPTQTKIVFSGDIGRPAQLMIKDPSIVREADYLFLESTYGNRNHKNEQDSLSELAEAISYSYKNGEKVIIPAFAVERTQEMIYSLYLLAKDGRLPKDMPIYIDSPLAMKATQIFRKYTAYFDEDTKELLNAGENPLNFAQVRFTKSTQESMALNEMSGSAIIISASGMAHAGRIKHHLRHNLWREGSSIVFVGFQAQGTTGRKIIDGAQRIRLFNEDIAVKAKIYTINGFSAHAGQGQIMDWLSHFVTKDMKIFLVHGEYSAQQALAQVIREKHNYEVIIPEYLEEASLKTGQEPERTEFPEKAAPRIDWDYIFSEMEAGLAQMKKRKVQLEGRSWVEQTDLREKILEVKRNLTEIVSEI
ncbi:MAG: MBL fold metallo-hydrolase [Deltaproteobacteria bacterium]|nr:MBL fold metallo-hydrolase [Deltaproteobacteria bacterium]